jgi:pimeloyl-ACP methyl ester carboxylesterase
MRAFRGVAAIIVAIGALVAPLGATPAAPVGTLGARYLQPTAMVDVGDGARLALYCTGHGAPTVLMDAGLGDGASTWASVQPQIAHTTRVCSYDRAGYGFSRGLPLPRTSDRIVAEMRGLVLRAPLATPVVLVGHSFGSYNVRLFASRYPRLVAGIVLVDGSHENQDRLFPPSVARASAGWIREERGCLALARAGRTPTDPDCQRPTQTIEAILSEAQSFDRSADEVRAARHPLGALPMVVVSSGRHGRSAGGGVSLADAYRTEAIWAHLQDDLATLSTSTDHVTVGNSGHYVHKDAPWVVIAAVQHVVTRAGRSVRR